jgi:hypothetical protein
MIFASRQEPTVCGRARPRTRLLKRVSAAAVFLAALLASAQQPAPQAAPQPAADSANAARKKEIADDSAKMLKLATDLKTEVDKTDKDTLSLSVIRKAGEIEKLAHSVKEMMKATPGAN